MTILAGFSVGKWCAPFGGNVWLIFVGGSLRIITRESKEIGLALLPAIGQIHLRHYFFDLGAFCQGEKPNGVSILKEQLFTY